MSADDGQVTAYCHEREREHFERALAGELGLELRPGSLRVVVGGAGGLLVTYVNTAGKPAQLRADLELAQLAVLIVRACDWQTAG